MTASEQVCSNCGRRYGEHGLGVNERCQFMFDKWGRPTPKEVKEYLAYRKHTNPRDKP